jgi:hypothetical protein
MSNFETLGFITEGNISTAPNEFYASTEDSYATITASGYLNDISAKIKQNDLFYINYLDASKFPLNTEESSLLTLLKVSYNPASMNWSLVPANLNQSGAQLLAALGFHSATASSTTTSATSTYSDALVTPASIAFARWPVAATPGNVEVVTSGNGSLTVINSSTAGVSTIGYFSIVGSLALQNLGVYVNQYSYAGGSATIVIADANILVGSIVVANFASAATAVKIETVAVAAGTVTLVCSGNPGVSVISYLAITPSSALVADGCYAATYASAGGSATVTITDANITTSSIVMADMSAQTNASYIEKVTPGAGSLTILLNTDAGAATFSYVATTSAEGSNPNGYLIASNNLSDVANAASSLANLGGVPLAGGQLTGSVLTVKANATQSSSAFTANGQSGVLTTASLTTAGAATTALTFNNSKITSTSVILVSLMGGTNAIPGIQLSCVYVSAGVATLNVTNNNAAGTALSGTLLIGYAVL